MNRIAVMQDISCAGRCSMTLALPVLSAMGQECVLLPTQLLSTHTAFPHPVRLDLGDFLRQTLRHWQEQKVEIDVLLLGYLGSSAALERAREAMELFPQAQVILDPAMGDKGKLYGGLGEDYPQALARLLPKAALVLPNVTEARLLTNCQEQDPAVLARALLERGCRRVLLTGVSREEGQVGFYYTDGEVSYLHQEEKLPSSHGTGDLFAAVVAGAMAQGESPVQAGIRAAGFVRRCLEATAQRDVFGLEFEKMLHTL